MTDDLISRQEVLDGIAELKKSPWATDKRGNGFEYLITEALDVVADLCVKQAPSVNPQEPKWIPVSERLPENRNQEVLISLEWGIDIGRYSDGEWSSEWINHYDDGNVLAWMPLPTPYEPQEIDHKCHTCEHYLSGEQDGSCGSYICKGYSNWESEDKK